MKRKSNNKRKKRIAIFISIIALIAAISSYFLFVKESKSANDKVVVKINKEKIFQSEIEQKVGEIFSGNISGNVMPTIESLPPEIIEAIAKEIYLERSLVKLAKENNLLKDELVKKEIQSSTNRILSSHYIDFAIKNGANDDKIYDKYVELNNDSSGKREFLINKIIVSDEKLANKIYTNLTKKKPEKFADLAKKHSIDKISAVSGGILGYLQEENLDKETSSIVLSMKSGEISKPFKTSSGWNIIKLVNVREFAAKDFESSKDDIKEQLIKEITGSIYNEIFKDVKIKILIKNEKNHDENNQTKSQEEK